MIDIAILVSNEVVELNKLLKNLTIECQIDVNHIYVLCDTAKYDMGVILVLNQYNISNIFHHKLNNDFATHRNYLLDRCLSPYVLFIDADETIPRLLIDSLMKSVTESQIDILAIPRVNKLVCNDATPATEIFDIKSIDPIDGKIAWPDYQLRFVRRTPSIRWVGAVHEVLIGGTVGYFIDSEDVAIQHIKTTSKQLAQRNYYRDNFK